VLLNKEADRALSQSPPWKPIPR